MITENELTQLRADIAETLISTCTVWRPAATVDSDYFANESGTAVASNIACRVDPYTGRTDLDGLIGEREAQRDYFRLTLAWNANIEVGDWVVYDGDRLDVLQLYEMHSGRAVTRALVARQGGG